MNTTKCRSLKAELSALPPREAILVIARFFDGNDDLGSIGCNLMEHPGMDAFRETLLALQTRRDVEALYATCGEKGDTPAL